MHVKVTTMNAGSYWSLIHEKDFGLEIRLSISVLRVSVAYCIASRAIASGNLMLVHTFL